MCEQPGQRGCVNGARVHARVHARATTCVSVPGSWQHVSATGAAAAHTCPSCAAAAPRPPLSPPPPPAHTPSSYRLANSRFSSHGPLRLTSMTSSKAASSSFHIQPSRVMPAALTNTVAAPSVLPSAASEWWAWAAPAAVSNICCTALDLQWGLPACGRCAVHHREIISSARCLGSYNLNKRARRVVT